MAWSDIANAIESLAPTIASVIGGPLAGTGVSALEKVFGLTPAPTAPITQRTNDVATAIAGATPEQLIDVQKAENDFKVQMAQLGFHDAETLKQLQVQDVTNAREMQIATKSITPPLLTAFITIGFFSILGMLAFHDLPASTKDILNVMVGSLGTAWLGAIHYWFGNTDSATPANSTQQ